MRPLQSVLLRVMLSVYQPLSADSTGCANCSVSAGHKHIGLAFGATFAGPFTDLTPHAPVFPFASEDPNIFRASTDF